LTVPDADRRAEPDGPTTPTRAGRLADASVDHTEARKAESYRARRDGLRP
jgi:hypothetical protein